MVVPLRRARQRNETRSKTTLFQKANLEEAGLPSLQGLGPTNPITPARSSWWMAAHRRTPLTSPVPLAMPTPQAPFTPGDEQDHPPPPCPYSLVTAAAVGGKAQQGGQAARRWSVWAWRPYARCLTPLQETAHRPNPTTCRAATEALNASSRASPIPRPAPARSHPT